MSVTTAQAVTLLENVLFESPTIAQANAASWVSQSATNSSLSSVAGLAAAMAATPEAEIAQQVVRYYMGALGRVPAGNEIQYYTSLVEAGLTADQLAQGASAVPGSEWAQIAAYFAASPEFATDFGLSTAGQVNSSNEVQVIFAFYANILGRVPNSNEVSYYQGLLNGGTSLATLVQYFTTSPEYQTSVDASIATALGTYGTDVVGGTTPPSIPLTPPGLTLGATPLTVNGTLNMSAVNVVGTPATAGQTAQTAVTGVIGVAPVTAATGVQGVSAVTAVAPVAGRSAVTAATDGAVTINDISSGTSGAGVIKSVILANSGAGSAINDNGLTSLTLIGTTGTLAITNLNTAAITAHASSLALVVNGLSATANTVTDTNNEIATLSVTTMTADSVLAGFADTNLTTLNVAGSNKLTLLSINSSLTALNVTGAASFSDGATTHNGGLAALGSSLTITDSSTGSFAAALDDTTQSFTGGAGADIITVSALVDATKTITGGSATTNEIIFEGGGYGLTSVSSGKFVNFQTVGVAADVTGIIDLSVVDPTATGVEVIGADSGITFSKAAKGASLLLDPSSGAVATVIYADSTGASDSVKVTMSSAVTSLTLQDSAGVGIGTVSIENDLGATDTNVSTAHVIGTLTDNGLSILTVTGAAGLSITTLNEATTPAASFTLNNASTNGYGVTIATFTDTALATLSFAGAGISTITALNTSAASLAITDSGTTLDYVGTITDTNLTSLSLAANVSLGQASTALTSNGLQDGSTAGVTVSGGSDNAHVTVNLTNGAASGKADSIILGNGNNVVVDASTAGTVTIGLGSGASLVELGSASLDTTAKFALTFAARTAAAPNVTYVGAAGTTYASAPNLVITGASTGDIIAFGNDSASSSSALSATSLTGVSSVGGAVTALEALVGDHTVVYGVYGGNTYIVESASGTIGASDTTVVEVVGAQTLTASGGYVTLGSSSSVLTGGGLGGASFTIPAGIVDSTLTLRTGSNVVTLTGPSNGVTDTFTSIAASTGLIVNYQATSGTDTIEMNGSAGGNQSDVKSLTVNDTSSGSAGVTIGAFTDNLLTGVTYNDSATSGAIVTQSALTSSSLATINLTGGVASQSTNTYFISATLTTQGPVTVNDSNLGSGATTMGLTLNGGTSALTLNMTGPGTLATGALTDNNLASLAITGSGAGNVNVGALSDSLAGAFTVTDSSSSTGSGVIILTGLTAATSLTVTDSASGSLTDSSAYNDPALATLTLRNTGAAALTMGNAGIQANALTNVVITGSGIGSISTGILTDTGSGPLTITDSDTSTGPVSLPISGVSAAATISIVDSAAGALSVTTLTDNSMTALSVTNTGTASLTVGAITANAMSNFTIAEGASAGISLGGISDTLAGAVSFTDNSLNSGGVALTLTSLPDATSVSFIDTATGALTVGAFTDSSAATLLFNNTGPALLTASGVTDSAAVVGLTLSGSGTGTDAISLIDAGATSLSITDSSMSTGAAAVTATLTGGPASVTVVDSAAGALTVSAFTDANLTSVTLTNTGSATLTMSGITGGSAFNSMLFQSSSGPIVVGSVTTTATSGNISIGSGDSGSVTLTSLTVGVNAIDDGALYLAATTGNLTVTGGTAYVTAIVLGNTGTGTVSATLTDLAAGALTVLFVDAGAQTLNLTDNVVAATIGQTGNGNVTLTLTHNGVNGEIIVLGNGNNSITLNDTTPSDSVGIGIGGGTNVISLPAVHSTANVIDFLGTMGSNTNVSPVTADSIHHFLADTGAVQGDTLDVGVTTLITTADANSGGNALWTVSAAGMMTKPGASVLNFIADVQSITQANGVASTSGIAGFSDGTNSWIAYNDHLGHVAVIELAGVIVSGIESGATLDAGYVHLM